ncbi:uncharacterized protein CIMG_12923 [Coccidioides immitis RS]|uniref:Uncharacterized protein n=1 Tax=Coccidioides immitis (strain RS) TaxID=246410 RepID=J3KG24_COCIM|nr:uncharacterized protein CIMG_12923 [Coccidioides immitis RS]EAS34648.3 hypothetical protein CIMG_12923 [Coccidioides immitis RS]
MSKASDSGNIQHRLVELALRSKDEDAYQPELSKSSEDEDNENTSNLDEHSAGSAPVANAQTSDSEHEHPQKEFWCKQFYLLLFLCDLGSMMLEPHQCSPLHCQGLLYCQFYNTIKKIFMASKHSLFANENLDTLALDLRLVQIWQHIRKAISHSPLALLRAYIYTKQQCHVIISDCCHGSNSLGKQSSQSSHSCASMPSALSQLSHQPASEVAAVEQQQAVYWI